MGSNINRNAPAKHGREAPIWAIFAMSGASALLTGLILIAVA